MIPASALSGARAQLARAMPIPVRIPLAICSKPPTIELVNPPTVSSVSSIASSSCPTPLAAAAADELIEESCWATVLNEVPAPAFLVRPVHRWRCLSRELSVEPLEARDDQQEWLLLADVGECKPRVLLLGEVPTDFEAFVASVPSFWTEPPAVARPLEASPAVLLLSPSPLTRMRQSRPFYGLDGLVHPLRSTSSVFRCRRTSAAAVPWTCQDRGYLDFSETCHEPTALISSGFRPSTSPVSEAFGVGRSGLDGHETAASPGASIPIEAEAVVASRHSLGVMSSLTCMKKGPLWPLVFVVLVIPIGRGLVGEDFRLIRRGCRRLR